MYSSSEMEDENSNQEQLISHFFDDGTIGAKVRSLLETTVSSTLLRSGFKPWFLGILNVNIGEIDCVVSGDFVAWKKLCELCPFSKARFTLNTSPTLFLVEVMSSSSEFIEKVKRFKTSPNENEGCFVDEDYWLLLDSSTSFEHKILFVNGGVQSKNWVMNGGSSTKLSERAAWMALEAKNVSLFYCESFSQEWVSDMSGNLMLLKTQNEEIKTELRDLQKSVQSLLAEKMK